MSNSPLSKKKALDSLKRFVFDNKVILLFVVLSIACILISETNLSYVAGEVFSRFGRNTCIVLALVIPCMAGLGMNFGIVVGAIAAQISIFWVVHWGFTGITGLLLCVLMTLYIMGGVIPYDDPNLLPRGFGLRNAFDLTGNLKYSLDDISFLTTAAVLSVVYMIATLVIALHDKKTGKQVSPKSLTCKLVGGVVVLVLSFVLRMVPVANEMLGGTRVLLSDTILLGGIGVLVYVAAMLVWKRPQKGSQELRTNLNLGILALVVLISNFIPALNTVYRSIRLPAMTYAVICLFAFFNTWILDTRLGQNMRTVGQSRAVATSAGLNVDKIRIIATCISTVLAAWGQLIFLQNLGTFNTVQQQDNVGLYAVVHPDVLLLWRYRSFSGTARLEVLRSQEGKVRKKKSTEAMLRYFFSDCGKTPSGLCDKFLQSAARIICPHRGDKFHTCSLRSVFRQVHALAENFLDFICRHGRQTL